MGTGTDIARYRKIGGSMHVLIPKPIADLLRWRDDDRVALRVAGDKLIVERVPIEELARVKVSPTEVLP